MNRFLVYWKKIEVLVGNIKNSLTKKFILILKRKYISKEESFIYEKNFTFFCFYKIICDFLYSAVQLEYRCMSIKEQNSTAFGFLSQKEWCHQNVKMMFKFAVLNPTAERSVSSKNTIYK